MGGERQREEKQGQSVEWLHMAGRMSLVFLRENPPRLPRRQPGGGGLVCGRGRTASGAADVWRRRRRRRLRRAAFAATQTEKKGGKKKKKKII